MSDLYVTVRPTVIKKTWSRLKDLCYRNSVLQQANRKGTESEIRNKVNRLPMTLKQIFIEFFITLTSYVHMYKNKNLDKSLLCLQI